MIDKAYFVRQATTLLRMARVVKDPRVAAVLANKAADLKARCDDTSSQPALLLARPERSASD